MITVRSALDEDVDACVNVLALLPDHFTPDTHDELRSTFSDGRAWVATDDRQGSDVVGFLFIRQRYERAVEITFAAVAPSRRRSGIGSALVEVALADLRRAGVRLVEVKTLDASSDYEPYVSTRAFWEAAGFDQIDCIDPLPGWQPGNPSAIYVAALSPTVIDGRPARGA